MLRMQVVDGRARKTEGHAKPRTEWNVLLRDHHPGYIGWDEFEANQKLISETAHMQSRTARKSARGGRALLTAWSAAGVAAAGCGSSMGPAPAMLTATTAAATTAMSAGGCASASAASASIGPSPHRSSRRFPNTPSRPPSAPPSNRREPMTTSGRHCAESLKRARYEASLAARRYEVVDPTKRLVARELEGTMEYRSRTGCPARGAHCSS